MVYGDLQFFDIVIFAVIAVFIIYRLRSVLGKRTGFQNKPNKQQFEKTQTIEILWFVGKEFSSRRSLKTVLYETKKSLALRSLQFFI